MTTVNKLSNNGGLTLLWWEFEQTYFESIIFIVFSMIFFTGNKEDGDNIVICITRNDRLFLCIFMTGSARRGRSICDFFLSAHNLFFWKSDRFILQCHICTLIIVNAFKMLKLWQCLTIFLEIVCLITCPFEISARITRTVARLKTLESQTL